MCMSVYMCMSVCILGVYIYIYIYIYRIVPAYLTLPLPTYISTEHRTGC